MRSWRDSIVTGFGMVALLWLFVAVLGGCGKTTTGPDSGGGTPFQYLAPTSPRNVLQNLVSAYVRRDSVETAAVYDVVYEGTSTDASSSTPVLTFTRADEIHHVGILMRTATIVTVNLDLGSPATWQRLPAYAGDPADWAVIPIFASTIRIEDIGTATTHYATNEPMEFAFKPTVAAPGDTTWKVVRWTEVAN